MGWDATSRGRACRACGVSIAQDLAFCTNCGTNQQAASGEFLASTAPAPNGSRPISSHADRRALSGSRLRTALVIGLVGIVAVALVLSRSFAGRDKQSESSQSTVSSPFETASSPSQPSADSVTVTSNIPPIGLRLGDFHPPCGGSQLIFDSAGKTTTFLKDDAISGNVLDRWKVDEFDVFYVACDESTAIFSTSVTAETVAVVDWQSELLDSITKFSPRIIRLNQEGQDTRCCFPDVPLAEAAVLQLTKNGRFKRTTSDIARYDGWSPQKNNCEFFTEPDRYPAQTVEGDSIPDGGYVTVCSRGPLVELLQSLLVNEGYNIDIDGLFGPDTLSALNSLSSRQGFGQVDGAFMNYSTGEGIYFGIGGQ